MAWHDYLSLALVAAAALVVGLRAYLALFGRPQTGCGTGCASCPNSVAKPDALLSIGPHLNQSGPR